MGNLFVRFYLINDDTPILTSFLSLFGCTTLAASLWAVFFLPETGGYAIEDMHQLWNGNVIKQSIRDNRFLFKMYNNAAVGAIGHERTGDVEHPEHKVAHRDSASKGSDEQLEKVREA